MKPIDSRRPREPLSHAGGAELARLFESFRPHLLAAAQRELLPHPIADLSGSDIVQETFLTAHEKWSNFRGGSAETLFSWLRAILRYKILQRRRQRRKALAAEAAHPPVGTFVAHLLEQVDSAPSPCQDLVQKEEHTRLLRLLNEMPDLKRQIIAGRIERNETYCEIAKRLVMSEDAVRMAFHRAIEELRGRFGTEGN